MATQNINGGYRLGIDVGVASLGLAVLPFDSAINPETGEADYTIAGGTVRTYPLPIGAEDRRGQRGMRRNLNSRKRRLERLSNILFTHGIGSRQENSSKEILDLSPIKLRAKASRERVELSHLASALLHMAKHRGSSAFRESDIENEDKETRQTAEGILNLRQEMRNLGFCTYGQYLRWREKKNRPIRINQQKMADSAASKDGYAFYPSREMLREEFDIICTEQAKHYPQVLRDDVIEMLARELFFQRKITPPPPGNCPFFPNEPKLAKASRLFQKRRIYEEVNHLRFYDKQGTSLPFSTKQRDHIVELLMAGDDLSYADIKKALGFARTDKVSAEEKLGSSKTIKGYPLNRIFDNAIDLGQTWESLAPNTQDQILDTLSSEHDDELAIERVCHILKCTEQTASAIVQVPIPAGFGNMGQTATERLLVQLKQDVVPARIAQDRAGIVHASSPDGVVYDRLPYYGEILVTHTTKPIWVSRYRRPSDTPPHTDPEENQFGRIPNPVVHLALNQLRKAVNATIDKYGLPETIHIELARDLNKSAEDREAETKRNLANQKTNDDIAKKLVNLKVPVNRKNIQKYKLWKEQGSLCVYTGKTISERDLYGSHVEVDHILPRSKTFSDAMNNKVVCFKSANADKNNRSPYEAFANTENYDWDAILRRVPKGKEWRFKADALEDFKDQDAFRARYGTDNSYIARVAAQYLSCLYGEPTKVVAVSSHIVALLRGKWGLQNILGSKADGTKARDDHRHHFVDALVSACATRGIVQRIQTEAKRCEKEGLSDFVEKIAPPFGDSKAFYTAAKDAVFNRVSVSRKPDHSTAGQLHEDTLMGLLSDEADKNGKYLCRKRKKLTDYVTLEKLNKAKIENSLPDLDEITTARSDLDEIKAAVAKCTVEATALLEVERENDIANGKKGKSITPNAIYSRAIELHKNGGGRTQFTLFEKQKLVNLRRDSGNNRPYGGYISGRNHRVDFYLDNKGKTRWQLISMMDANNAAFAAETSKPENTTLWSVHKDDVLLMDDPDNPCERIRVVVAKFSEGKLTVCPIHDARDASNRKTWGEKGLSFYTQHRAQRIVTDSLGDIVWRFPALPGGQRDGARS